MARSEVPFFVFYQMWGDHRGWDVPPVHLKVCEWLENRGESAVLRAHRGFAKSTLLGAYNAWRYYRDNTYRILHQSESDGTAYKTSRDTQNVLRNHPLTRGMFRDGGVQEWWVEGATDPRNASMYAKGILSNVTSARADECQNDDVEVPRNIQTPEAREKLRYRLGEQVHILVPGGRTLYVGTPHTHDSIYDEMEAMGADCLTIAMFEHEYRIEQATKAAYEIPFSPEFVFSGIGKQARLMVEGKDYTIKGKRLVFAAAPGGLIDCYSGVAWPERFDSKELEKRRKKTRTINEWDSQYQLHSKPVHDVRLDPDRMIPYEVEPVITRANKEIILMLGNVRLVGVKARWDCSLGKVNSDASALSVIFTDAMGRLYWHRAVGLTGDLEVWDEREKHLIGGQIKQLMDVLVPLKVPQLIIETNGPGGFVPAIARKHLKKVGISVVEDFVTSDSAKNKRILDALEPPLSSGFLWAHTSVLEGDAYDEMKGFNPAMRDQPDDYLDSAGGAISATPVRIGKEVGKPTDVQNDDWRPSAGVHEVVLET